MLMGKKFTFYSDGVWNRDQGWIAAKKLFEMIWPDIKLKQEEIGISYMEDRTVPSPCDCPVLGIQNVQLTNVKPHVKEVGSFHNSHASIEDGHGITPGGHYRNPLW